MRARVFPICFAVCHLLVAVSGGATTMFSETFVKAKGTLSESRGIQLGGGVGTLSILNGPVPYGSVSNGEIVLNGNVVFSGADFRATGFISKEVIFVNDENSLEVTLKGSSGGAVYVEIDAYPTPPLDTVFVATPLNGGSDSYDCGLEIETPCASITHGMDRAEESFSSSVAVSNGTYWEDLNLIPGIQVSGGWAPDFLSADLENTATFIIGTGISPATVIADSVTIPTRFAGFVVFGPVANTPGQNSIGIWVKGSDDFLVIESNTILAGVAGDGLDGADGGSGANGAAGEPGASAVGIEASLPGGVGGAYGTGNFGGNGGLSSAPVYDSRNGYGFPGGGSGPVGGKGGFNGKISKGPLSGGCVRVDATSGFSCIPGQAEDGLNGSPGLNGNGGEGGLNAGSGLSASGEWVSASGLDGGNGSAGTGGSGGGAGGGADINSVSDPCTPAVVTGPSGGGGGESGAGGFGGAFGQGGGSAFGIFVFNQSGGPPLPIIRNNTVFLGVGGGGGNGGVGGAGGVGGSGAPGGECSPLTFGCGPAGSGGAGGDGGCGRGGGGGAGGVAVGIFSNVDAGYGSYNSVDSAMAKAGTGGLGGPSCGLSAEVGEDGAVYEVLIQ